MRRIIPFNENWIFVKPGEDPVPVTLPHTWNAADGQDGGGDYWRGECVYRKDFSAPETGEGEEVYLEFDGASAEARVTVNGRYVGEHRGLRYGVSPERGLYLLRGHIPGGAAGGGAQGTL